MLLIFLAIFLQKVGEMIIMYITSGISIQDDVYYNHMDTRYSMNYRVRVMKWTLRTQCLCGLQANLLKRWQRFGNIFEAVKNLVSMNFRLS